MKDWQIFEKLTCNVQRDLSPNADVTHNENIRGKSGIMNQCDVVIRSRIGTISFLGIIECKDHESKIGVEVIRGFKAKLDDIGAMKGIIVSAEGFTSDAYKYAKEHGIDAYLLVDANSIKWNKHALVPLVLCNVYLSSCVCSNHYIHNGNKVELDSGVRYWHYDKKNSQFIELRSFAESVWDNLAGDTNNFKGEKIFYESASDQYELCENGKPNIPVILKLEIGATFNYHYGHLTVDDGRGYIEEKTRTFHSKKFMCKPFDWRKAIENWPSTKNKKDVPFDPIMWLWAIKYFSPRGNHASEFMLMGGGFE